MTAARPRRSKLCPEILLAPSKQKKEVSEAAAPVAPQPSPAAKKMDEAFEQLAGQIMKEAQKATSEAIAGINKKPALPSASSEPGEPLHELQGNTAPIPVPDTALNIEFDGAGGSLDFKSESGVRAVATFYRTAMKPTGWKEQPTVIDQDNMVVLRFSKGERGHLDHGHAARQDVWTSAPAARASSRLRREARRRLLRTCRLLGAPASSTRRLSSRSMISRSR